MKKIIVLSLFALCTAGSVLADVNTAKENNDNLIIYKESTASKFPDAVKAVVNNTFSDVKTSCNPNATYIVDSESIVVRNDDISTVYYQGKLRVYNEHDVSMVRQLGTVDHEGRPYRERGFTVIRKNGVFHLSSMSCEAGGWQN